MVEVVAAANPRLPKVSPIQASCHIRRPSSKKLTKLELQAVERTLLEEKANLLKEMEVWRKSLDALRADNSKLQTRLMLLPNTPFSFHKLVEDVQLPGICVPAAPSPPPGQKDFIPLPDLNDPVADC